MCLSSTPLYPLPSHSLVDRLNIRYSNSFTFSFQDSQQRWLLPRFSLGSLFWSRLAPSMSSKRKPAAVQQPTLAALARVRNFHPALQTTWLGCHCNIVTILLVFVPGNQQALALPRVCCSTQDSRCLTAGELQGVAAGRVRPELAGRVECEIGQCAKGSDFAHGHCG